MNGQSADKKVSKRSRYIIRCVACDLVDYAERCGVSTIILEDLRFSAVKGFSSGDFRAYVDGLAQMRGINVRYINAANTSKEWFRDNFELKEKEEIRRVRPGYIIRSDRGGLKFVYDPGGNLVTTSFSETGELSLNKIKFGHRDFSATASLMRRYVQKYV